MDYCEACKTTEYAICATCGCHFRPPADQCSECRSEGDR